MERLNYQEIKNSPTQLPKGRNGVAWYESGDEWNYTFPAPDPVSNDSIQLDSTDGKKRGNTLWYPQTENWLVKQPRPSDSLFIVIPISSFRNSDFLNDKVKKFDRLIKDDKDLILQAIDEVVRERVANIHQLERNKTCTWVLIAVVGLGSAASGSTVYKTINNSDFSSLDKTLLAVAIAAALATALIFVACYLKKMSQNLGEQRDPRDIAQTIEIRYGNKVKEIEEQQINKGLRVLGDDAIN